jgi:hypothetical protein
MDWLAGVLDGPVGFASMKALRSYIGYTRIELQAVKVRSQPRQSKNSVDVTLRQSKQAAEVDSQSRPYTQTVKPPNKPTQ